MKNLIQKTHYQPLTPDESALDIIRTWFQEEQNGDINARSAAEIEIQKYLLETADGTVTLRSDKVNNSSETMHSSHGAYLEAHEKFVIPAGLGDKKNVSVLDICSGLGINSAAVLEQLIYGNEGNENACMERLEIDMVEISPETLAASLLIPSPCRSHQIIKETIEKYLINNNYLKYSQETKVIIEFPVVVEIKVFCNDARHAIKEFLPNKRYDAIFLDPFSPSKSPELYSQEFLSKLSFLLKEDGVILTYTSAAPVRYALINAGLEIGEGPQMKRSGGTVASHNINKISKPLKFNDERMIALSDAGIPYRDSKLEDSSDAIHIRRQHERIESRGKFKMASTVKAPTYLAQKVSDEKTQRRVLKHLKSLRIHDTTSLKARFLVCPQFSECICDCNQKIFSNSSKLSTSRERIKEMEKRLDIITKMDKN